MHSIFSARLILNIRKAAKVRQVELSTGGEAYTLPHEQSFLELQILPASDVKRTSHVGRTSLGTGVGVGAGVDESWLCIE